MACRISPEHIDHLEPNEIFVFGSNVQGSHAGGAARFAVEHFGAIEGLGVGAQGQAYAIPTMSGSVDKIRVYVDNFTHYAKMNYTQTFYVTKIGCGRAGYKPEEIAPLFLEASKLDNVLLPKEFVDVIERIR